MRDPENVYPPTQPSMRHKCLLNYAASAMAAAHGIVLKRTGPVEMYAVVMTGIVAENRG